MLKPLLCAGLLAGVIGQSNPAAPAGSSETPCAADLNCSGAIDVADLLILLGDWGQAGTPSDLTGSGTVDVTDLLVLLSAWGPCEFTYIPRRNPEAEWMVFELIGPDGPLQIPDHPYERIDRDMTLIREALPGLAQVIHPPLWATDRLLIELPLPRVGSGSGTGSFSLDCLNAFYQVQSMTPIGTPSPTSSWYILQFPGPLNMAALKQIYTNAPEVIQAETDNVLFRDDEWTFVDQGNGTWRWTILEGYHACEAGCLCWVRSVIDVDADETVHLISCNHAFGPFCSPNMPGTPGCAF